MTRPLPSRRNFLASSGTALAGAWLLGLEPLLREAALQARDARTAGLPFAVFTGREAADFDAFSARIIPTDDTPGAREAGAVHFADNVLGGVLGDLLPPIREGLAAMTERVAETFPGRAAFAELSEEEQDRIVGATETEDPSFFFLGRTLVTLAMVTNPDHGGNRDGVGWALMGFRPDFAHRPPFGFYDRGEHGEGREEDA